VRLDLQSGFRFFQQMIVERHAPPQTAFHDLLFQYIAQQPIIAAMISWLRSPDAPDPDTDVQVNDLTKALLDHLTPYVDEALNFYIEHHWEISFGFQEIAKARKLVPPEDREVQGVRKQIVRQLVIPLLGQTLSDAPAPPVERTFEVWALGGSKGKKRLPGGWVTSRKKLKNVVFQYLLGPGMDGSLKFRRSGAIVQGLIHWYFSEVLHIPFTINAFVGYVHCPHNSSIRTMLVLPLEAEAPICPLCNNALSFNRDNSHRIVAQRQNITGQILSDEHGEDLGLDGLCTWKIWELYKCPPEHWRDHLLDIGLVDNTILGQEQHFYPDQPKPRVWTERCHVSLSYPEEAPGRKIHSFDKPSQRPTRLYFLVQISTQEPARSDADDVASLLLPHLPELYKQYQNNARMKAVIVTLGLNEEALHHHETLMQVCRNFCVMLQHWSASSGNPAQFEQKAANELRRVLESLPKGPAGTVPWRNQYDFSCLLCELLDELAELIAEREGLEEPRYTQKGEQLWKS
jgi:hypothetical protein